MLQRLQQVYDEVVQRFEGYVAQHVHDGMVVYFGYPQAHEDDALRALHAAFAMLHANTALCEEFKEHHGVVCSMRFGIHTGVAIIGALDRTETRPQMAIGAPSRIAAQVAQLAEPNTVLMSAATLPLVENAVTRRTLGAYILNDAAEALVVYHVLQVHPLARRLAVDPHAKRTPFVGREHDLYVLHERWQQSQAGRGQVVIVSGEPGIGKSRLIQVFCEALQGEDYRLLESWCSAYYQHSALHPVIEQLQHWLQWQVDDTPTDKLTKLEQALQAYAFSLTDAVPLLASLLSLPLPSHYPPSTLPPQQKHHTFDILLNWLFKQAAQRPVCLVVEDMHWVDPSTLEFVTLLINQAPTVRLLLLVTCRPTFEPPWLGRSHVTQITLTRLPQRQAERLLVQVTGGKALPLEVHKHVLAKTNGVPLFMEEMLKMVVESGWVKEKNTEYEVTGTFPALAIPSTLHASLLARLDRQGVGKVVAQWGATVGQEFSYALLAALVPLDDTTLQQGLAQLVQAEILHQRGLPPQAQYRFKHALIQDTAYQSLLRRTQRQHHRHIAEVLEAQFPEMWDTEPELLAHHYTAAGLHSKAVVYWYQAGQHAGARSAYLEAIVHLRRGLTVVATLPQTHERWQDELNLCLALGVALIATYGNAAPQVEEAYSRAQVCCEQSGNALQLFTVVRGLWLVSVARGELWTAHARGMHLLRLAYEQTDPLLQLEANRVVGTSMLFLGDLDAAWEHLQKGLALYEAAQHHVLTARYRQDPGMACLIYAAWILWLRGYPEQALASIHQALALAQECQHPFCLALAHTFVVTLHWYRGEMPLVCEQVETCLSLARTYAFPLFEAMGMVFQGGVQVKQGRHNEGLEQMRQGIRAYQATGAALYLPYLLGLLAEAYGHSGHAEVGLEVLDQALNRVQATGERPFEAVLYRLKGELLLQVGFPPASAAPCMPTTNHPHPHTAEAESCLQHALSIARRQHATSLELQIAMSAYRLWQQAEKHTQAQRLLKTIYQRFTEGFHTGDLQEARRLLETGE